MQTVTVEKTVVTNAPVKFGWKQLFKPTPQIAKNIFRVVLYAAALTNIFLMVIDEIPPHVEAIVGKYSIYAVTLVHMISKLFGIDITGVEPPASVRHYPKTTQ